MWLTLYLTAKLAFYKKLYGEVRRGEKLGVKQAMKKYMKNVLKVH